jgi:hypothetical protein
LSSILAEETPPPIFIGGKIGPDAYDVDTAVSIRNQWGIARSRSSIASRLGS